MKMWSAWTTGLSRFVYGARRQDGKPYPGSNLGNICAGIQRILTEKCDSSTTVHIFKKDDLTFRSFHQALGKRAKELIVGAQVGHKDHERILWDTDTFNVNTAERLPYCVYSYNSQVFGLRAVDEHVSLQWMNMSICNGWTCQSAMDEHDSLQWIYMSVCRQSSSLLGWMKRTADSCSFKVAYPGQWREM